MFIRGLPEGSASLSPLLPILISVFNSCRFGSSTKYVPQKAEELIEICHREVRKVLERVAYFFMYKVSPCWTSITAWKGLRRSSLLIRLLQSGRHASLVELSLLDGASNLLLMYSMPLILLLLERLAGLAYEISSNQWTPIACHRS